jgi:hypothetical protein
MTQWQGNVQDLNLSNWTSRQKNVKKKEKQQTSEQIDTIVLKLFADFFRIFYPPVTQYLLLSWFHRTFSE